MDIFFIFLPLLSILTFFVSLLLGFVGLFYPRFALFWKSENRTKKESFKTYSLLCLFSIVVFFTIILNGDYKSPLNQEIDKPLSTKIEEPQEETFEGLEQTVKSLPKKSIKEFEVLNLEKLKKAQSDWIDYTLIDWNGKFVVGAEKNLPNKIIFEFSKAASRSYDINKETNLPIFQNSYEKFITKRLGKDYLEKARETNIDFKINSTIKLETKKYFSGLVYLDAKLYKNGYYYGKITDKLKIEGRKYIDIKRPDGNTVRAETRDLRNGQYYYIESNLKGKSWSDSWIIVD